MASKKAESILSENLRHGQREREIRETAYSLYEERRAQNAEGDEQSDWLAAEALIHAKHHSK